MPDNFICGKCGKVAKTKQALERHAAYHENDRPFSCEVCLQRFKNSDDRGKHYRRLKRDGKFPVACTVCHKHFKTDEIYKKHIEMLGCNVADVDVERDQNATRPKNETSEASAITPKEELIPSDGITCTCKICETEFVSTTSLKKHYKEAHNDNKRQVCMQCGQTLSSKDSLARHFSIFHQTSFPYPCDKCDQKFKIKESLCRHVKFVHQDGGYQCPECHRVFSQPVNLRKHLAVHSTQKEFACKSCGREFKWKQALQKHELLHEMQSSSRNDKTVDNASSLRNDLDLITNTNDEINDENEVDGDNDIDEFEAHGDMQEESVTQEKQISEKESVSNNVNIGSFYKYPSKNAQRSAICSVADDFNFGNGSLLNPRKGNTVSKEFDEYEFPDDDDLDHGSSDKTASRKRLNTPTDNECNDIKKFKISGDMSSKNRDRSLSTEQNVGNTGNHNATIEGNKMNNCSQMHLLQKAFPPCEKSGDLSETSDSTNNANNKVKSYGKDTSHFGNVSENDLVSEQSIENLETDIKHRYSALTSFPTDNAKDAPKLIFKPSSIQNILSGPEENPKTAGSIADEKSDDELEHSRKQTWFGLPAKLGYLHTKLHNPFLIQNRNRNSPSIGSAYNKEDQLKEHDKTVTESVHDTSKSATAPPDQMIPRGKFSLVKHMLSLQNEENFDKTIFENPLYNKPADVKDFEQFVERHRVTDKTDDSVVQSYDLSGKQNIPFHWLGLSAAKRKKSLINGGNKNDVETNDSEREEKASKEHKDKQNDMIATKTHDSSGIYTSEEFTVKKRQNDMTITKTHDSSGMYTGMESSEKTSGIENTDTDHIQQASGRESFHGKSTASSQEYMHRGFQAIKNLVAAHKNDIQYRTHAEKSVLTNPFDYENEYFQDKATDLSSNNKETVALKVHSHNNSQSKVHSAETFVAMTTAEEKEHMFNLNRAADQDISRNKRNISERDFYRRHHSVGTYSKSPLISPSFSYSQHSLQLPRAFSGTATSASNVTNSVQISRSQSIPCTSGYTTHLQLQRTWGSDSAMRPEKCLDNTAASDSAELLPFIPHERSEKDTGFQNKEVAIVGDSNSTHIEREPVAGMQTDIMPHRQIDLMMINKNLAQLHKLNHGRFDRKDLRWFVRSLSTRENVSRNESESHEVQSSSEPLPYRSKRPEGHGVILPNVPVNEKVTNDLDTSKASMSGAYSPVHSTYTPNMSQPLDALDHNQHFESDISYLRKNPQVQHDTSSLEKPYLVRSNGKDCITADLQRRRNVHAIERDGRVQDIDRKSVSQQGVKRKTEVSVFDMLNGQEDKWNEYDNIETLLGSYI
ncbi:uncharacterized protein LOC123541792 [Mercenaria mercenaria]|uniref:uncharacterized protein LOC123541792 n=1 Tax=Mercenaria mercenaria TaxID=6596 RepID=UPI00234FB24C|nr:uncharacterized protein LOC123541792 [Mercenaria mercenaria]